MADADYRQGCEIEFALLPETATVSAELFVRTSTDAEEENWLRVDLFEIPLDSTRSTEEHVTALLVAWNAQAKEIIEDRAWEYTKPAILATGLAYRNSYLKEHEVYLVSVIVLWDFLEAL